ncbi:hypothetical protein [Amycolatopsis nalaikhensis]|uniref:Uncharacterized protein n=1 Tax=Amycolatopsis nalaikhensis TaxID=715472 RepID=A0ABY8XY80_9PSEU|nr:hypothetical protein [Amycolatopsis sp. 2-2]WIV60697.1 hypothetical protein QP939_19825 [Amycolatopsis sp. 2-2]
MRKTQRRHGLLGMLVRAGWKPRRRTWTVPCRDRAGRRVHAEILIAERGPALAIGSTVAVLNPMDAGRLRAALREAIDLYARLDGATREGAPTPRRHPGPLPTPHREVPGGRHTADTATAGPVLLREDDDEPTGRHARRATLLDSEAA